MFNRFDSKYGNFLTILLVIAIIAIVGLLGFLGYDMYRKYYTISEADEITKQFENQGKEQQNNTNTTNITVVNTNETTDNPLANLQYVTPNSSGTSNNTVKYEDYTVVGIIEIPKTKVKYPILEKVTKRSIEIAVAVQYSPKIAEGTPNVNEIGNTVIIGHNYRNGLFFSNNKNLVLGDKILIKNNEGNTITYVIYNKYETTPNDTDYMIRNTDGKREISLSTCTDDGNKRLIIWAREE